MGVDGSDRRAITFSTRGGPAEGAWNLGGSDACAWPCWSPDGRWIACFRSPGGEDDLADASVNVVEVDGVEELQLLDLAGQLPIYAQWSPDSARLAVLAQDEDELELQVCRLDRVGHKRIVDKGVPLFCSWTPDGEGLLVHAGGKKERPGRLMVRRPTMGEDSLFDDRPGSFCVPVFIGERAIYVTGGGTSARVVASDADGRNRHELAAMEGLVALLPDPAGRRLALAHAPGGEMTPYQGIWLLSSEGSDIRPLVEQPLMAFFWEPDGGGLLFATVDARRGCLWWWRRRLDSTVDERLAAFRPTRDQLFHLHFFEQYARSHPLVTPDGSTLVYAAWPDPRANGAEASAQIFALDLHHPTRPALPVAHGTLAVAPLRRIEAELREDDPTLS